jgi:hypothetical protein
MIGKAIPHYRIVEMLGDSRLVRVRLAVPLQRG